MTTVLDRFARKKTFYYLLHCRLRGTDDEHGPKRSIGGDTARGAAPVVGNRKGIPCFGAKRKKKERKALSIVHTHTPIDFQRFRFLFCYYSFVLEWIPSRPVQLFRQECCRSIEAWRPSFLSSYSPLSRILSFRRWIGVVCRCCGLVSTGSCLSRSCLPLFSLPTKKNNTKQKKNKEKNTEYSTKKNIQKRNETAAVGECPSRGRIRCSLICKPLV
mmetsp:Transcript_21540/g.51029  ORF Transcript_21540/g.51029 Transcript_21540/m.51029 type:complete len:216 (+) Transcript_21540:1122-1769(+)